ncbi:extracellular solute-binding protein [Alphaproteobacteria bacterium]|nr:extracellular solute-binding protein [Alphaproteobacteria bacterium]
MKKNKLLSFLLILLFPFFVFSQETSIKKMHGISAQGLPKYKEGFQCYDFVNLNAPKKGKITIGEVGSFDSLNPWILKGISSKKIPITRATLLARSPEEPFTMYCAVAETLEFPEDRAWVIFNLRPEARWDHGKTITADDIIFSYNAWIKYGQPFMRTFYKKVQKIERLSEKRVKFIFKNSKKDRELPMIMGMMPLIPKDVYEGKDLNKIALQPLVSNGPYRIKSFEPGRYILFERVKDFWGKDLPTYKGRFNFDEVQIDYYLSGSTLFEAFKSGKIDVMEEEDPQKWKRNYIFSSSKKIIKEEIEHKKPVGMSSFVYNSRREIFKDPSVRKALTLAFDFERLNTALFYGMYTRTRSFFDHTELLPHGKPSGRELSILKKYKGRVHPSIFEESYQPPVNESPFQKRANLKKALDLLKDAGWVLERGRLVQEKTKTPFSFEIILNSREYEKIALEFIRNLEPLGIEVQVRILDEAQYERRKVDFDYDMIYQFWAGTRSPGNELINYVSSKAASINGSRNYPGIKDEVIDELIQNIIRSEDRQTLVANVKVLDRILMVGNYVLPLFHLTKDMIAYKSKLSHPDIEPVMESRIESWWDAS